MARKKRKRRSWADYRQEDPGDGLEINSISESRFASKKSWQMSVFDADNAAMEYKDNGGRRRFHKVSIMGEVRRANISKTRKMNGYKDRIKGR
jgi:hypothetical protein